MTENRTHIFLWLFTLTVFILSLVPLLVQDGMFIDGVLYAGISKNLANNLGSLWQPHFTQTFSNEFYGHPPLVFGIQSLFFKVLGKSIYVERFFSLSNGILSLVGISLIWRLNFKDTPFKKFDWLPVLLWIITPVISASFRNNLLVNTVTVFTLFSSYFIIKAIIENKQIFLFIGSLFIALVFFSKGPFGLFPLVISFVYWLCFSRISFMKNLKIFAILLFSSVGLILLLFLIQPESLNNISRYLDIQLLPSLQNELYTRSSRFYILIRLFLELLPSILITLAVIFTFRKRLKNNNDIKFGQAAFFILIGLCASIPILVTLKQHPNYIVPSIPFFVIGLSVIIVPFIKDILEMIKSRTEKKLRIFSIILFSLSLLFSFSFIGKSGGADGLIAGILGKHSQNKDKLHDVYILSSIIPEGTIISVNKNFPRDSELRNYLGRIGYISVDWNSEHEFILTDTKSMDELPSDEYREVPNLTLIKYKLFKRVK